MVVYVRGGSEVISVFRSSIILEYLLQIGAMQLGVGN